MHATDVDECDVPVRRTAAGGKAPGIRAVALAAIACLGLIVGALVYFTDRMAPQVPLLRSVATLQHHHLFGAVGLWLPSFLHTLSFSLLTAAAWPLAKSPPYGVCAAWCAVNVAFELGQHPSIRPGLTDSLRLLFGDTTPIRVLSDNFLRGTFDVGDIVAAIAGALAAAALLYLVHPQRRATCEVS